MRQRHCQGGCARTQPSRLADAGRTCRGPGDWAGNRQTEADGIKLDDEQNVVMTKELDEAIQAAMVAHKAEIDAAQRMYMAGHP